MQLQLVPCPLCQTPLVGPNENRRYTCPNPDCRCPDGKSTMYGVYMPLIWLEHKAGQVQNIWETPQKPEEETTPE